MAKPRARLTNFIRQKKAQQDKLLKQFFAISDFLLLVCWESSGILAKFIDFFVAVTDEIVKNRQSCGH